MRNALIVATVSIFLLAFGASYGQKEVKWTEYGWDDIQDEQVIKLASGDSIRINQYNFYQSAESPNTEDATQFCSGQWIHKKGKPELEWDLGSGTCTRVYLESGDVQRVIWKSTGLGKWTWHTVGGTGKYANVKCEGTGHNKMDIDAVVLSPPWRFVNIITGICTEE